MRLLKVRNRQVRIDAENVGGHRRKRDRNEVLVGIVGQVLVQKLVGGEDRRRGEQDGVAVGGRLFERVDPDDAVGAGPILDDNRLRPGLAQLVRNQARDEVERAARRKRNDEFDRPIGIILGQARACAKTHERNGNRREDRQEPPPLSFHVQTTPWLPIRPVAQKQEAGRAAAAASRRRRRRSREPCAARPDERVISCKDR